MSNHIIFCTSITACRENEVRFGDSCIFKVTSGSTTAPFSKNAGDCMDNLGSVLWYPDSNEEIAFVKHHFDIQVTDSIHMGFKNFSQTWGMTFADATYSPGIPFYTNRKIYF